jgi:predicted CxxxxCH...CXXCH cytochrome family protein
MRAVLALVLVAAACSAERAREGGGGGVHGAGILVPTSDDWHGAALASVGWDLAACAACHDRAVSGGATPCETCHADTPAGCASCHGMPPATDAHRAHALSGQPDSCKACHPVPAHWRDAGHLGARAEIVFAAIAGPAASFDGTRCSNVACHGAALGDPTATNTRPAWNGGPAEATCGSCHGAPPAHHVSPGGWACGACHPTGAAHVDGLVEVGRSGGCDGCHGSATSPAPPVDLTGDLFTTARGVGAHQAHLVGPNRLRGPIGCATCHLVPVARDDLGHLDTGPPAEVDPAIGWERASATCAAWCHGAGRPAWTSTGEVFCGSCHGIPPADAAHAPGLRLTDCATCHPGAVDASGYPIVLNGPSGPTSEHIDGHVDL